jgi:hypothetical protein
LIPTNGSVPLSVSVTHISPTILRLHQNRNWFSLRTKGWDNMYPNWTVLKGGLIRVKEVLIQLN